MHGVVATALALIPLEGQMEGSRSEESAWSRVVVTVARAEPAMEWPQVIEPVEVWDAPEVTQEVPAELDEAHLPARVWFDEPVSEDGTLPAPPPRTDEMFDDVPDDLFKPAEPVSDEPVELDEPVETPDVAPTEELVDPPQEEIPPIDEPPLEETPSDEVPERDGDAEDEDATGDGEEESPFLSAPTPRYPKSARAQGKQGEVLLSIHVGPDGSVVSVGVKVSSGHRVLDEAARQAVLNHWRFRPRRDSDPEVRTYVESVSFKLR